MYKFKVFLVFIIITSSVLLYQVTDSNQLAWQEVDIPVLKNDIPVNFMAVLNDKNFTDYGFSGNGTKNNPYRIEDYIISEFVYHNGIVVINTTKHFIIQNCILMALWSAIFIENVAEGTAIINGNTLVYSEVGIAVQNSKGVEISSNTCGPYNDFGIFLYNTSETLVSNNDCFENEQRGIYSYKAVSNRYEVNNCSFIDTLALNLLNEQNATIINNFCKDSTRGGILDVDNSTIRNNVFERNYYFGCKLLDTRYSTIYYNIFAFNGEHGCLAENVDNSDFKGNYIANNSDYGLLLNKFSSNNTVYHNSFIGNNPGGTSQARDNGEPGSNIWYNQELEEGNYWSGWEKNKPYPLDGLAENVDKYPLNSSLERLDIKFAYFIISLLLIGIAAILKRNFFNNLT